LSVRSLRLFSGFIFLFIFLVLAQSASAQTIVLYAYQAPVKVGKWSVVADSSAAGSFRLANADTGAAKVTTALAAPSSYVEIQFYANAGQAYHLWMRGKAASDSPYNDSVHVQFSGSVTSGGSPIYRIGTSSSTEYNLEDCLGCAVQGWGWQDNGWGTLGPAIYFQSSGVQTIRIQEREDGLSLDQIILSPSTYLSNSPGALKNDGVILTAFSGTPTATPTPTPISTPIPTPTPAPAPPPPSSASDVVIWGSNVPSTSLRGSWIRESNGSAAGQVALRHPDGGAGKISTALASPSSYFDVSFNAVAGTGYRLWVRGRADSDHWGNDSVFVQFSGSLTSSGSATYRIGTTSAMEVNLEDCSGCGVQGWGWQDNGWGVGVLGPVVYFQSTGTQTIRVQTREDGFSIDQIVLSPSQYLFSAPGASKNDGVILWYTEGAPAPAPAPTPTPTPTPAPVQNQPPQLSISATPTSGLSPLLVSFSSSASDPDGFIASYFWNFGDSTSSNLPSPQHWYATGSYAASLTVTDNSGASTTRNVTINVTPPASTPPPASAQIKVLSWNVSFGQGTDGVTNWNRIATYIANFNADLVALCEMPPADIGNLVSLLSQKTGSTWYSHFVPKWPGYEYEGNLILSKYSFSSTSARYLSYERSVAQATVNIGGRNVNFFSTHLDHTSSSLRYQQVTELQSFTSGFSETRIVAGDFNAGPDLSEAIHMSEQYYDSWVNAMNIGTASAYSDNPVYMHTRTRRGRIDYVWLSKNSNSVIKSAQIPDVRDLNNKNVVVSLGTADDWGVRPSDHNPTIAIIELR
jgi:endonuclease/exonuclease/phosphatase family metal-dependent hydrolase